jgi:hypothetical protein
VGYLCTRHKNLKSFHPPIVEVSVILTGEKPASRWFSSMSRLLNEAFLHSDNNWMFEYLPKKMLAELRRVLPVTPTVGFAEALQQMLLLARGGEFAVDKLNQVINALLRTVNAPHEASTGAETLCDFAAAAMLVFIGGLLAYGYRGLRLSESFGQLLEETTARLNPHEGTLAGPVD